MYFGHVELEVLTVPDPGIRTHIHHARLDLDLADISVTKVLNLEFVAFFDPFHEVEQTAVCFGAFVGTQGFAINRGNHITGTQSRVVCGAAGRHTENIDAFNGPLFLVAADGDAKPGLAHQLHDRLFNFDYPRQVLLAQFGNPSGGFFQLALGLAHLLACFRLFQAHCGPALLGFLPRLFVFRTLRSRLAGQQQRGRGRYQYFHRLHQSGSPETVKMRFAAPAHSACQPATSST